MISKVRQRLANKGYYHNYQKKQEFQEILEDSKVSASVTSSIKRHKKIVIDSDSIGSSNDNIQPVRCIQTSRRPLKIISDIVSTSSSNEDN